MLLKKLSILLLLCVFSLGLRAQEKTLNVVIAGLDHVMVAEVLNSYRNGDINILGIAEPDANLAESYRRVYNFPTNIIYTNLVDVLKNTKPDVILAYNVTAEHVKVVEVAAPLGIPAFLEKPLSLNNKDADRISSLAKKYKIKVLTNYINFWYPGNQEVYKKVKEERKIGAIVKMAAIDGNVGPGKMGVSRAFLSWLTDPSKSGGGVLYDLGCYGANLITWLMDGEMPVSVTAETRQLNPGVYPKVENDLSISLEYKKVSGMIKSSWNLDGDFDSFEVVGDSGSIQSSGKQMVKASRGVSTENDIYKAADLNDFKSNYLGYIAAALKNTDESENELSSLRNNIVVMKILVAAKESAKTGEKVYLK